MIRFFSVHIFTFADVTAICLFLIFVIGASNSTTAYTFDANGNLKTDLNKGISSNITYNSLNLPRNLTISNTSGSATNTYTYTADGRLITAARGSATTQYAGHMIYEGTTLKRILVDGGYIEGSTCYYYLTDHLGNNRVVAHASGMTFDDSTEPAEQPYKYGGKEFDKERSLNWSDFEARQYMNDVPMFTTMDPLAEKYYSYSPYAYCANNPLKYIDPDGKEIVIGSTWDRFLSFFGYKTDYVKKVEADLSQLKNDNEDVKAMIIKLEESPNEHKILKPDKGQFNSFQYDDKEKAKQNMSQGSTIRYDPDNKKNVNGVTRTPRVGLSHELSHSLDAEKGASFTDKTENDISTTEVRAVNIENKVREQTNDPKRTTYGGKSIPEDLLD